jgi:hypothetical protein
VNVLKPNQRATVITLLERSTPQREITRTTSIDRKTIRSYHLRWLADLSNSPTLVTGSRRRRQAWPSKLTSHNLTAQPGGI